MDDSDLYMYQEEKEKSLVAKVLGPDALQGRISTLATEESKDLYWSYFSKVCCFVGSVGELMCMVLA